jgi:selenocysteine lyase/cysteine desulfurase
MQAVLGWLEAAGVTVADIRAHVTGLQDRLLTTAPLPGELVPPLPHDRGNFLTFRSKAAGDHYRSLHERGVITDYRGDRLRIGFGIYQDGSDVDRLATEFAELPVTG